MGIPGRWTKLVLSQISGQVPGLDQDSSFVHRLVFPGNAVHLLCIAPLQNIAFNIQDREGHQGYHRIVRHIDLQAAFQAADAMQHRQGEPVLESEVIGVFVGTGSFLTYRGFFLFATP